MPIDQAKPIHPVIASPEVVHYVCKRFGLHMSKKLGQNFLIRRSVVDTIVEAADLSETDQVFEIGPGIGTLTQGLAESGAQVKAVELDKRLPDILAHTLDGYTNVDIIQGDVLKVNLPDIMGHKPFKVVANLPYYITTPIVLSLLESHLPIERMVMMVQREVAERMIAGPGSKLYGALSVAIQYYTKPEIVLDVPPKAFLPAPEVTSAVIKCILRDRPPVDVLEEKRFFRVAKAAFAQRRKTFANSMRTTGLSKEAIAAILEEAGIDGQRRGETLSIEEMAQLANVWTKYEKEEA